MGIDRGYFSIHLCILLRLNPEAVTHDNLTPTFKLPGTMTNVNFFKTKTNAMKTQTRMKLFKITILALWISISFLLASAQTAPVIQWQNTIGGNDYDLLQSVIQTIDGGYLLGGYSASGNSGDKIEANQGNEDYWVVKLDESGNNEWQNTIGGNSVDELFSVIPTMDGGYLLGGNSDSGLSGDKTQSSQGGSDYWVVKLDSSGNIEWENTIGGSSDDYLRGH